ncbi:MAG: hypothetical protein Q8M94_02430 [Ignavibacteria bacterium]|nr:hypothetical protein [Ignavibacteria bacterium]
MKIKIFKLLSFIIILAFIFVGCEKEYDNVIDSQNAFFQVDSVILKSFYKYPLDSVATLGIKLNSSSDVKGIFFDIYAPDNKKVNNSSFIMYDSGNPENGDSISGDNIYSSRIKFDSTGIFGNYSIKYFVEDIYSRINQVAIAQFFYDNGQVKSPPYIYNLILADSVQRNVKFVFSVDVTDSNSLADVVSVYYELYRPDSSKVVNSQGISEFPLFDDGDIVLHSDEIANDGRFTIYLIFPNSVSNGLWRFEFQAKDRSDKLSNKIIKSVKVL